MNKVKEKILKSDYVRWRDMQVIQPEGFKELTKDAYNKLKASIAQNVEFCGFEHSENNEIAKMGKCPIPQKTPQHMRKKGRTKNVWYGAIK